MSRLKNSSHWIDISVPIKSGMVHWPGDQGIVIKRTHNIEKGDAANVSLISLGGHTGTHMDPPLHFIRRGKPLDQMPIEATVGEARVIFIKDQESIKPDELKRHAIKRGERVLFKTVNSFRCWKKKTFQKNFVYIAKEAAAYLAQRKVMTVGVDYLSIGGFYKDGVETHRALLGAGVWVIEGLNLAAVKPGTYQLICLPLRVWNSDGAPARAVVKRK